jgi:osmotically-inducible protein OsmY
VSEVHSQLQASVPTNGLSVGERRLAARVDARLRWDKSLEGAHIEVRATSADIALRGTLRDESQRPRAVELAESTLGVDKVSDEMTVE